MKEPEFHELVAAWLRDSFAHVEHEPTLPSGREPDFVATTPFRIHVLEVEDSSDTLYNALGQALVYARELSEHRGTPVNPVAVFPADSAPPHDRYRGVRIETV